MGYFGKERRKYQRTQISFTVSYRLINDKNFDLAQTKDISSGGFLLVTDKKIKEQESVILEIKDLVDMELVQLMGKVLSSKLSANGITYETRVSIFVVNQEHKDFINKLIDKFPNK